MLGIASSKRSAQSRRRPITAGPRYGVCQIVQFVVLEELPQLTPQAMKAASKDKSRFADRPFYLLQ